MYTPPSDPTQEPEHVARHLSDAIAATWLAFDRGRAVADEFFAADERRTYDAHVWAHLARYEAALSLAEESGPRNWSLRLYHHSGIEITKEPHTVRVCKATGDGSPQSPGRNRARRSFFQQLGLLSSLLGGGEGANLILYWRVREDALELGLCKPRGLWRFKGRPKLEWHQPVHYDPLEGLSFPTAEDEDVDVSLQFEVNDFNEGEEAGE